MTLAEPAAKKIAEATAAAEQRTSAEIKVVVTNYCWTDIRKKARALFSRHNLHKTKDRNAVMILLVLANREFLIYGDKGINEKVPKDFWLTVRDAMQAKFRGGDLAGGICVGVEKAGEQLAKYFPKTLADRNELSNEVVHEG